MSLKFRGLSVDEYNEDARNWKYGHLIEDKGESFIINQVIESNEQYITIGSWCPVKSDTVGQSTGLFDKNIIEVFEGDIITNGRDILLVKKHSTLGFYVEKDGEVEFLADGAILEEFDEFVEEFAANIEVLGNVYQNRNLLES